MTVIRVTELLATSPTSWEDAVNNGLERATKTIRNVRGIDVLGWKAEVQNEKIVEYRVRMKVAFEVEDSHDPLRHSHYNRFLAKEWCRYYNLGCRGFFLAYFLFKAWLLQMFYHNVCLHVSKGAKFLPACKAPILDFF
jgi:flavin-binding protein dodecin